MESDPKKILVVDDDPMIIRLISRMVQKYRPQDRIISAHTFKEATIRLDREKFDFIISDFYLPDGTGKMVLDRTNPPSIRVGISGQAQMPDFGTNCDLFLAKPMGFKELQAIFSHETLKNKNK